MVVPKFRVWDDENKVMWNIERWHIEDEYFDNTYCVKTKNGVYNSLWINAEYYEVIGNIYENPELLEEETNDQ